MKNTTHFYCTQISRSSDRKIFDSAQETVSRFILLPKGVEIHVSHQGYKLSTAQISLAFINNCEVTMYKQQFIMHIGTNKYLVYIHVHATKLIPYDSKIPFFVYDKHISLVIYLKWFLYQQQRRLAWHTVACLNCFRI